MLDEMSLRLKKLRTLAGSGLALWLVACGTSSAETDQSRPAPVVTPSPAGAPTATPSGQPPRMVATRVARSRPARTASPSPEGSPAALPEELRRVIALTNQERQEAGLSPLRPNSNLMQAARSYAETMAEQDCFGHHCGPIPSPVERIERAGYTDWSRTGENIAVSPPTPEAVIEGWMNSPPHRENILDPDFREIGVGRASVNGRTYWVQEFGALFEDSPTR